MSNAHTSPPIASTANAVRNIVILISGSGSNMQAIVQTAQRDDWAHRLNARVAAVISNRADAKGLQWAQAHAAMQDATPNAPPSLIADCLAHTDFDSRAAFDVALAERIDTHAPSLVVLAGFMRLLTPAFVARFEGRLLNIHPSLLPAFTGLHTHQRALDAGCRFAGASVHWVSAELDAGAIVDQAVVPVLPGDDAAQLAARVLTQEHLIYPRAIARWLAVQAQHNQAHF
jgi:phosphoribosylglycinamide formyltransferase 1